MQVCHAVIQVVYTVLRARHGQHLSNIDHRAAADRNDTVILFTAQVVQNGVHHHVCRLARTVLLLKTGLAAEVQRRDRRVIDVLVGQDEIACAKVQFLRHRTKIRVFCNSRHDSKGFHLICPLFLRYPENTLRPAPLPTRIPSPWW